MAGTTRLPFAQRSYLYNATGTARASLVRPCGRATVLCCRNFGPLGRDTIRHRQRNGPDSAAQPEAQGRSGAGLGADRDKNLSHFSDFK
jgi:hypothetical protein